MPPPKSAPQKRRISPASKWAFTRADLLVTLAVVGLLALVILPALANQRPRSARVICANNLRQIGLGFQLWGNDHADAPPFEVAVSDNGTLQHPLAVNSWLHFSWISNQLANARTLFCPSDSGRPARDFSFDQNGGYVHPNFANRATSYTLFHSAAIRIPGISRAADVLSCDRKISASSAVNGCARFNSALGSDGGGGRPAFQWTNSLHGSAGNLLHFDGRVDQLSNGEVRHSVPDGSDDNSQLHFITPR